MSAPTIYILWENAPHDGYIRKWSPEPFEGATRYDVSKFNDGWIEWNGGECPVPGRSDIEIRFRCGRSERLPISHKEDWAHEPNDADADIIAYRVVSK